MLRSLILPQKLRLSLVKSGITGEIRAHGAKTNLESIKRLLKKDPYVTFGVDAVHTAIDKKQITYDRMLEVMACALGTSTERFCQPGPGYIDPQLTAARLNEMIDLIDEVATAGGTFVVATAHPGSLMNYYFKLIDYINARGGKVYRAQELVKVGDYRWIDQVAGVHVLSDEGNILHTHDAGGFAIFLKSLPLKPDLVITDHGYAGAAMNAGLKTVALHDVDDPGIPLAAELGADVLVIPMNDNQLNLPTASAITAILDARPA